MTSAIFTRKEIVTAYCYLREAERSIHRALNPACRWSDFVGYYQPSKLAALQHFAGRFQPALPIADHAFPSQQDACRVREPGLLSILYGICFGRWQQAWRLADDEIAYLGAVFGAIVHLLKAATKPGADILISARMATYDAERILESRCQGLSELQRAMRVAHFDQSPSLATVTVSDILRDVA